MPQNLGRIELQPVLEVRNTPVVDALSVATETDFSGPGILFSVQAIISGGTIPQAKPVYAVVNLNSAGGSRSRLINDYVSLSRGAEWHGFLPVDKTYAVVARGQLLNNASATLLIVRAIWGLSVD